MDLLLQAPKITREVAAMNWQFVDAPPDGTIMLIWQPPQLGTHSATDGLIYYGPEAAFSSEVRGYVGDTRNAWKIIALITHRPSKCTITELDIILPVKP